MGKLRLYDSTRLDAAKNCMRYYYLRHEKHWRSEGTHAALVFGSSWGTGLDVIWAGYKEITDPRARSALVERAYEAFLVKWTAEGFAHPDQMTVDDLDALAPRTPMIAMEMLHEYIKAREHFFTDPTFELLSIEQPFIVPLNPDDPTLFYVGRQDKVFRWRKRVYGLDHKTTSLYRGTQKNKDYHFAPDWIDSWGMNDQVDGYSFVGHQQYGAEFAGIYIDGALVHKTAHNIFIIVPIDKQMPQLNKWLWNAHTWIDQIEANKSVLAEREAADTPYLAAFPENRKSCISFNSKCQYFDTCRMVSNPAKLREPPPGFVLSPWQPFDELKLEKIGLAKEDVLA